MTFYQKKGKEYAQQDIVLEASVDLTATAGDGKVDFSEMTGVFKTPTGAHTIGGDLNLAAGKDLTATAGAGEVDLSAMTGTFKTPTGAHTINGAVTLAANKGIAYTAGTGAADFSNGTGVTKTTTGTFTIGGDTVIAAGKDVSITAGDSAVDLSNGTGLFKTTTGAVTIGPGAIGLTGDVTLAAGKNLTGTAGAGVVDLSAMTGGFKTPTGAITIGGAVTFAADKGIATTAGTGAFDFSNGTGLFKTSTGAVTIGPGAIGLTGDVTVATSKTLAVTDADKLIVGGVVVPQKMVINFPIDASTVSGNVFIANDAWVITSIEEVHSVAGDDGGSPTIAVVKCTDTQAPSAGTNMSTGTINPKGTAETVQTLTLSATAGDYTLADGNRIGLLVTGNLTSLAGGIITIHMRRA